MIPVRSNAQYNSQLCERRLKEIEQQKFLKGKEMTVLSLLTRNASHSWGNQLISLITWYKLLSASKDIIPVMLFSRRVDYLMTQRKEEKQTNNQQV